MVEAAVHHDNGVFTVKGAHKVFALKNQPAACFTRATKAARSPRLLT